MSRHRLFRRQISLRRNAKGFAFFLVILLVSGCGEEAINNPIVETYIPGCENRVQMEPVCLIDSLSKGMIGRVLLSRYW